MLPVVALVGRPNVGKSTLFNRLTRSRDALVADFPGLTRDRHYGEGRVGEKPFIVVDTGGFEPIKTEGIVKEMTNQAQLAVEESDIIFFLVDGRSGLIPQDQRIAQSLRESGKPTYLVVNKAEGMSEVVKSEFYELALGEPYPISAAHGEGVRALVDMALEKYPTEKEIEKDGDFAHKIRVAIAGRPNAGKSTLINALIGEERLIAFDMPGTTRDAIEVEFQYKDKDYILIDTAGLRRKGKVFEAIEKFSVIKTLQAIEKSNVVVLLLDAKAGISEQDANIAGYILESGRALVIAINKWDDIGEYERTRVREEFEHKIHFLKWAKSLYISALYKRGLGNLLTAVNEAHAAAFVKLSTPKLTRALIEATTRQLPPRARGGRPKMRYAHQGGMNPPVIVIHGNALQDVPESYKRYLEGFFREKFNLKGTPLRIELRTNKNPYAQND
ncbi:ribosome biogenesis GTPase Der [Turicimonas muris]|uniref:GTPase Der n=4 Tax=Turicimonas muris TaxID=1796652 RepID=A0A227KQM0_9BURK|nr:ribosome biogenesis GTPase Der [Turicimonas muris]ANU65017.1 ribosome biogenesis GTPase Der [Burkholderiales bacterium YL45]MBS4767751.1 ribosome biogenesis GTPase Der [Burkholderiales bacterium]OXE50819.1 ribosome biogenesis GTPase Der [Turicimonas muris]QQQ96178.1 ribosome biogenesis GTPase Der [Turicimonas muris]